MGIDMIHSRICCSCLIAVLACVCQADEPLPLEYERGREELAKQRAALPALKAIIERCPDADHRLESVTTVGEFSLEEAVPVLIAATSDNDARIRYRAVEALHRVDIVKETVVSAAEGRLADTNRAVQLQAIQTLSTLGDPAAKAVPALIQLARDNTNDPAILYTIFHAFRRLGTIAGEATPFVIEQLGKIEGDDSSDERVICIQALRAIGTSHEATAVAFIEAMDDPDPDVAVRAYWGLIDMGPAYADAIVPTTIDYLNDPATDCEYTISWAVEALGPAAEPMVPAIIDKLRNGEWEPERAIELIQAIRGELPPELTSFVVEEIGKATGPVWLCPGTSQADARLSKSAIPQLRELLRSERLPTRLYAAAAIAAMGPAAEPALPELRTLFSERDKHPEAWAAAIALGRIGASEETLPVFVEALESYEGDERLRVWMTLCRMGPSAQAAGPGFVQAVHSDKDWVYGLHGLAQIGTADPKEFELLLQTLKSPKENRRREAAKALLEWASCPAALADDGKLARKAFTAVMRAGLEDPSGVGASVVHGAYAAQTGFDVFPAYNAHLAIPDATEIIVELLPTVREANWDPIIYLPLRWDRPVPKELLPRLIELYIQTDSISSRHAIRPLVYGAQGRTSTDPYWDWSMESDAYGWFLPGDLDIDGIKKAALPPVDEEW